jgi:NAD-dependent dihydropyrimidine dehydrogenase PreA subunit
MIELTWDEKKCASPQECRQCLDVCPQGVFGIYARDARGPGKPAGNWAIAPVYLNLCTGCDVCAERCPEGAITVRVAA